MSMIFCRGCGKEIHETAITCPHCGAPQTIGVNNPIGFGKKQSSAFLLAFFLGGLGGHRFYLGNIGLGILYLFTFGLLGIGAIIDSINLAFMRPEVFGAKYNNGAAGQPIGSWAKALAMIIPVIFVMAIVMSIVIPSYQDYKQRHTNSETKSTDKATQTENKPDTSSNNTGLYEWKSSWGQGVSEFSAEDGNGNKLYIACSEETAISAIAYIGGAVFSSENEGFDVVVDGNTYSNPFYTDCRACAGGFETFWTALRKANNIKISSAGKSAVIPTKNIGKILPAFSYTSKDSVCRTAF